MDVSTQYCEAVSGSLFTQPLNIFSCLAYILAAFVAYRTLRDYKLSNLFIFPFLLLLVGICSVWWHFNNSSFGNLLDTLSIAIFASAVTFMFLAKITKSRIIIGLTFILILTITMITQPIRWFNGSLTYLVLLISFCIIGFIYIKKFSNAKKYFIGSLLAFSIAILFRSVDMILCSYIPFGTHFIWHILVACFGYSLIMMLACSGLKK